MRFPRPALLAQLPLLFGWVLLAQPSDPDMVLQHDEPEGARVTDVYLHGYPEIHRAGLNQSIEIKVQNLKALMDQASEEGKSIVLYINHIQLTGLGQLPSNPDQGTLVFKLARNENDKGSWTRLLGAPTGFEKMVDVSVGLKDHYPLPTDVDDFSLIVMRRFWALFTLVFILVLTVTLFKLAKNTEILRDNVPKVGDLPRPYSLSRTQMAFWFLLTMASMLVIWAITGGLDGPTASVLTLIGIGSGTALGAAMIESGSDGQPNAGTRKQIDFFKQQIQTLEGEIEGLGQKISAKPAPKDDALSRLQGQMAAKEKEKAEVEAQLKEVESPAYFYASQGFWQDILTDAKGVSFHRFQMVVFTLILGIVFMVDVYQNLAMPEFDATLLSLMGISSGTYLGFKFPEN